MHRDTRLETIELMGLTFDNLNIGEVVSELFARPRGAHFAYLVTPNADHLARLKQHPRLRPLYESAWLCVLDSQAIAHLARWLGRPVPAVATGADITRRLLAAMSPQTVAVIGLSLPAMRKLRAHYPRLAFIHHEPPPNLLHNEIALRRARDFAVQTNARFTFIALGSPVQEYLAFEISRQPIATGTGLCIGAALEYCAGTVKRAPPIMRAAGLEWLFRLVQNPARLWRRYLIDDPPLIGALIKETFRQSRPDQPLPTSPDAISAPDPYPRAPSAPLQKTQDEP